MARKPKSQSNTALYSPPKSHNQPQRFSRTSKIAPRPDNSAYSTPSPWWTYDENVLPSAVFSACRSYKSMWGLNYVDLVNNALRYADRQYNSFYGQSPYIKSVPNQLLSLNVTASCIDTLVSKVAKHIPSISYITSGGDYHLQEEAEKLEKFIHGLFQYKNIDRIAPLTLKDACVLGTGIVHVREHHLKRELLYERVKAYELIFDWNGAMNETLTDFHVLKFINRYDLIAEYPEFEDDILRTPSQNDFLTTAVQNTQTVIVAYSYSFYAKRHTVCVSNKCLVNTEWNFKDIYGDPLLPLALMRYEHDDRGFFGIGLSEKLKAVQTELNKLVRTAQMASHLGATPKLLVPRQADLNKASFDNSMGGIIMYNHPFAPTSIPMMNIPVDLFTQIDSFYRRAFEVAGISQMSASSSIPKQVESGKAMETMYQIESDRFQMLGQEYENLYIDLNNITLAFYEQLPEMSYKALVQTYYKEDESATIKFKDINIRRDQCYLKAFPISQLPQTPEGQFAEVYRRMQAGLITLQQGQKLLRMPDTEMYTDLATAELDYVDKQLSNMVRGIPEEPIAIQNIEMALGQATSHYFYYATRNLAAENLALIQSYIQTCQRLINQQVQEAQANAIQQQLAIQSAGNNPNQPAGGGSNQPPSPVSGGAQPPPA